MSGSFDPTALVSRRKIAQKVSTKVQRFSWDDSILKLVPDTTGNIVFIDDVIKVIEGKD